MLSSQHFSSLFGRDYHYWNYIAKDTWWRNSLACRGWCYICLWGGLFEPSFLLLASVPWRQRCSDTALVIYTRCRSSTRQKSGFMEPPVWGWWRGGGSTQGDAATGGKGQRLRQSRDPEWMRAVTGRGQRRPRTTWEDDSRTEDEMSVEWRDFTPLLKQ